MNYIQSDIIPVRGAVVSKQGGRAENQDDFGFMDTPLGFLLIVCDGMGGGPGGKTASHIVKYEIASALCQCNDRTPKDYALTMAVERANDALLQKMSEVPALNGMGSAFVAILIDKYSAIVAHAGDSRCYRFHGKRMRYRSQDHSLVAELVKIKALTEEQARISPQSNVITRCLGSSSNHTPQIDEMPYNKGDRFVLCTDGVWGIMPHKDLLVRLTANMEQGNLVSTLSTEIDSIGFAGGGGHDNHTLAIIDMETNSQLRGLLDWRRPVVLYPTAGIALLLIVGIFIWIMCKPGKNAEEEVSTEETTVTTDSGQTGIQDTGQESRADETGGNAEAEVPCQVPQSTDADAVDQKTSGTTDVSAEDEDVTKATTAADERLSDASYKELSESIQNLIDKYAKLEELKTDNENTAKTDLGKACNEITSLTNKLNSSLLEKDLLQNEDISSTWNLIMAEVSNSNKWYVDKPDKHNKYRLTKATKNIMEKQIEQLNIIKQLITNEYNHTPD